METAVKKRNIVSLWHFTKLENVDLILTDGLVPRAVLEDKKAPVVYNDELRLDKCKDANCLSIGYPNYKMFYSLREKNNAQKWVIVALKPDILWLEDCAFCNENAASNNVTEIPLDLRKGTTAFQKLFVPIEGKPSRETLKLPDAYPTNPQAEVLVFGTIAPRYIIEIITPNKLTAQRLKGKHPNFKFLHKPELYSSRLDYECW